MSYPNRDIFLSKNEQENIRKMLGPVKTVSEYLGKAAKYLKEGKGLAKSLAESAPWLKDVAEATAAATPIIGVAVKLAEKWLERTHPYELGAVACTLAYQDAAREAVEQVWTSAIGYQDAMKIDDRVAERIRSLPPAEEADLSSFSRDAALQHAFVRRADDILGELTQAAGLGEEQRVKVFNLTHERFIRKLDLLLSDKKTAAKFAPFKDWMEMDSGRQGALAALQIHAKYQRDQYLSEPLFKREPYALGHIYVSTECGKLTWGEIRGPRDARRGEDFARSADRRDPFSENHGGRHNLLDTVMGFITDRSFKEPIVIQGVAGAGKSSFTLRLCAELWEKGFHPLRIRLKRLRLSSSLIDALNEAIELADEDRLADLPIARPKDLLVGGEVFRTPYGGDHSLCRYVLILDGWDELDLSDSRPFREKVGEMLREVRRVFLDPQRAPRVRVIVTGRPSPDVVESKFLNDDTPVLTMRPIHPQQLREFVERLDDALGSIPPYVAVENPDEWRAPHRHTLDTAFIKYEETFNVSLPKYDEGGNIKEPGRAPKSNSLEVLGLPLLAYLTIRVMAQMVKSGDPLEKQQAVINEMVENPTLLYRSLTDLTCEKAGKAAFDSRDRGDEVERQWREVGWSLRERLRRTAAAMSVLGVEHISREEWKRRALQDEKEERETQTAEDQPLTRLMISFYFKGGQPEQGCEFAHKSFREYLFAERIVETLKDYGRNLNEKDAERAPARDYWRDFSREEDRPRYDFSREMAYVLAPQWIAPSVWDHLQRLIEWEISRAATASNAPPDDNRLSGAPTQALSFERWKYVRDGLADLWEWWADCAHLRPQVKTDRWKKSVIEPPFVEELIRWAAPLTAEENEALPLESATSIDAHLGDALCQICAMAHFYIAVNEGLEQIKLETLEYAESSGKRKYQQLARRDQIELVLFAPGGENIRRGFINPNPNFKHYCARINSAFDSPLREFPSRAILHGTYLAGANISLQTIINAQLTFVNLSGATLSGADLEGTSLEGANLSRTNLYSTGFYAANLHDANLYSANLSGADLGETILAGADFRDVFNLTCEQIELAWIDEKTKLPEELEEVKPEILERQRLRREEIEEGLWSALEVVAPEKQEEE
ncbi:MAG: pentapeptide repeat-containing protein [Blastocatellia bacterium]